MEWFRWFEGTATDPKFHLLARKSGQPVAFVLAVWAMLLERASTAKPRGGIAGFDCESADAVMGMPDGAACAIVEAMQAKGLIDGERVCKWEERQPVRERHEGNPSTGRVRQFRERQRNAINGDETPCNASETPRNAQRREDKRREEKNINTPPYPPEGGGGGLGPVDSLPPEEPKAAEPPSHTPDIELEQFLDAYPERARQPIYAVLPAWLSMKKTRAYPGLPRLFDALCEWENSEQWTKEGGRFIPSPQKFLSGRYWLNKPPRPPDPYANLRGKSFHEINAADYEARLARDTE